MYLDPYLVDEYAAHIRRERADAASRARLIRRARHPVQPADLSASLVERVIAAFRPAPEPYPTC